MAFGPTIKPCAWPGCDQLVSDAQHCPVHRASSSTWARGYDKRWQRESKAYLARNPRCVRCSRRATLVDHVVPIVSGVDRFDQTNWQAMCTPCHNNKTRLTQMPWRPRYAKRER